MQDLERILLWTVYAAGVQARNRRPQADVTTGGVYWYASLSAVLAGIT